MPRQGRLDYDPPRPRGARLGDTNSGRSRRFLLYQYRATDAWPLLGLKDGIEKFNEQLIVGEPSLAPRLVPLPVRMPLPPAEYGLDAVADRARQRPALLRDP